MIKIYKTGTFDSAHRIKGHSKCGRLHGHTYKYEIWISTETLDKEFNFVLDYHTIKNYFDTKDHSDIILEDSAEMISILAYKYFKKILPDAVIKVRIWETQSSYAQYTE